MEFGIPHMRATFKVTIRGTTQTNCKSGQDTRRIDHFVELFSSNKLGIPVTKFKLGPFRTADGVGLQFLQLCGKTATEIDLDEVNVGKLSVFTIEDVSVLLRFFSNIEVLIWPHSLISRSGNIVKLFPNSIPTVPCLKKVIFRGDFGNDRLKFCPTLIEELMTAAPNISDMCETDSYDDEENEDGNINVTLNCIEKLGRESSIRSLNFYNVTTKDIEHLQKMAMNGLKLKTLHLTRNRRFIRAGIDAIQVQLATCFKDSLEYLNVGEDVDNILMEFTNMSKLKSLRQGIKRRFDIKAVNLNENFSALETLSMFIDDNEGQEDWDKLFSEFDPCPTIKSLNMKHNYIKIHTFDNFLIIFPNLTKLNFQVNYEDIQILRLIWAYMTQLESLSFRAYIDRTEKAYLDSLFTGIPTRALKSIRHVLDDLKEMTVQMRKETILDLVREHCRLPSIRNLTKLRHLEVNIDGKFRLTDVCAYLAFYSMNRLIRLHHLDITECDFTKSCCEVLTKETGLETWSFKNGKYENIIPQFVLPERY